MNSSDCFRAGLRFASIVALALLAGCAPQACGCPIVFSSNAHSIIALFITDVSSTPAIDEYVASEQISTIMTSQIVGSATTLQRPTSIATTPLGIYVVDTDADAIDFFALEATGNVEPTMRIVGAATQLSAPSAIAIGLDGSIYVGDGGSAPLLKFAPNATGNVAPIATFGAPIADVSALTRDASGNIYVADPKSAAIFELPPTLSGVTRSISGSLTTLNNPSALIIDQNANIIVGDYASATGGIVDTFAPSATGNVKPMRVLAGSATQLSVPTGLAIDSEGDLFVANLAKSLASFAPLASGNVAPIGQLMAFPPQGMFGDYPYVAPTAAAALRRSAFQRNR